jgi:hypothetical protein
MKSNIDAIMQAKNLDALLVFGHGEHNPPMYYFTGGGHIMHATLIKKRGAEPVFRIANMIMMNCSKRRIKMICWQLPCVWS